MKERQQPQQKYKVTRKDRLKGKKEDDRESNGE